MLIQMSTWYSILAAIIILMNYFIVDGFILVSAIIDAMKKMKKENEA